MTYLPDVDQNDNPLKSKFIINRQRAAIPLPQRTFGFNSGGDFGEMVHLQGCVNLAKPLPEGRHFGDGAELLFVEDKSDQALIFSKAPDANCGDTERTPHSPRAPPRGLRTVSNEGDATS
jgi:hypothetical protein